MNIRKPTDYTAMFAALDALTAAQLPQMELYCEIGRVVSGRVEKGAAVAASEYLQTAYPAAEGYSPRNVRRMRAFYAAYEESPEIMQLAMNLGWTRNAAILERCGSNEERAWYIQAVLRFGWKKGKLLEAIESQAWLHSSLDDQALSCYTEEKEVSQESESNEENTLCVPRQYLQKSLKSPVISRLFRLEGSATTPVSLDVTKILKSRSSLWKAKRISMEWIMCWQEITTFRI